jgi:type IV secretory pathway VirJ component
MLSVFNHAVPADLAKQAVEPDGHWLTLAMCFAEIAGAEPRVPQNPEVETALLSAPPPTLQTSQAHGAMEIQFTGRDAPRQYTVWSITVNGAGRALAAEAHIYPERIYAENASAAQPPSLPITAEPVQPAPPAIAQPESSQPAEAPSAPPAPSAAAQPILVQPAQPVVEQPGTPAPATEPAPSAPAPAAAPPSQPAAVAPAAEPAPQEPARKEKKVKEKKVHQKNSDDQIEPTVREMPDLPDLPEKPIPN